MDSGLFCGEMSSGGNSSGGGSGGEISDTIKDFVFDLHDATRRSFRVDDVHQLYENKFKVLPPPSPPSPPPFPVSL